jgi:hypothetical protein
VEQTTTDAEETTRKLAEVFGTVLLGDIIEALVVAYWQKMFQTENDGSQLRYVVYTEAQNVVETLLTRWEGIAKCLRELY